MSARILVVDDIPANVKLLEAKLTAEYFQVVTAANGPQALEICGRGMCDIVLLDVMMPGMDGFEVCRRLKADPKTLHLPVVIVTALDSVQDRVAGLEAGADDFLTKPVNDLALVTRVRSLVRLKLLTDELGARAATTSQIALEPSPAASLAGRILLVDDRASSRDRIVSGLSRDHSVTVEADPQEALFKAAEGNFDLAIVSLELAAHDGLRLCSQLRSLERTRMLPILVVDSADADGRVIRALELGVNDYIARPIDRNEMLARVRTQIRRKRYSDQLRDNVQLTIEMAITDGLTGLYNRRYFERHLATLIGQAAGRGRPLSLLLIDIDHFKAINDTHGHLAGDAVLREFAERIRRAVRGIDLACRFGGEEFVVAMPETDVSLAVLVGERIRERISGELFALGAGQPPIGVTVSIGISTMETTTDTVHSLLQRGDEALYRAKHTGRNRVVSAAA